MATNWLAGRTIYHLHSLGAAGVAPTNPDPTATDVCDRGVQRLLPWLDHIAELGSGAVLLTPIFVSSTHGYDTVDPFRIDQRLGDDADFDAFVARCHDLDLRVVLDGVFNHVGRSFPPFADVLEHGRASQYVDWFHIDFARDGGDGFQYKSFEGHRELVTLNHANPAILEWAASLANHWLARDADGWRFDAAYAIPRPFLAALSAHIRAEHPDAFLFGEMIHGDYTGFVHETTLDSVTQYELYKAIWSSLNDANFFEAGWALKRFRECLPTFAPVTFAGNHDVTRLATVLQDAHHITHAVAIVATLPGIPCVYYGDEFAWQGLKEQRAGGDDAIRPALPPAGPVPPTDDQHTKMVLAAHRELIAFRRARPWLTQGALELFKVANRALTYTVTSAPNAIAVALTVDVDSSPPPLPDGSWTTVYRAPGVIIGERGP